jgi:hypothetical protein
VINGIVGRADAGEADFKGHVRSRDEVCSFGKRWKTRRWRGGVKQAIVEFTNLSGLNG